MYDHLRSILRGDGGCFEIRLPRVPDCFPRPKTPDGCFDPFPRDRRHPETPTARSDRSDGRRKEHPRGHRRPV